MRNPATVLVLAFSLGGCTTKPVIELSEKQQAILGRELHWELYTAPEHTEPDYHEHCVVCTAVIREEPRDEREHAHGYTTDDKSHWVCRDCFDRIKGGFRWVPTQRARSAIESGLKAPAAP